MDYRFVRIDDAVWDLDPGYPVPYCPTHMLPLSLTWNGGTSSRYACPEDKQMFIFSREHTAQREYVRSRVAAKSLKDIKVLNLDDEAIPLAEAKDTGEDNPYFVVARLTKSKVGLRLVAYAGEKGNPNKVQLFVEPEIRRLSFDQKDLNPLDVFTSVEAVFRDGSKVRLEE